MIPLPLDEIDCAALQRLIEQQRNEDHSIEYKERLAGNADSEKVPWLLKPICSFANSEGGDLVLGLRSEQGSPAELVGVDFGADSVDATLLRLDQVIRSSLEPAVMGVRIKAVALTGGRMAVVIRVPKSWTAPHRVKGNRTFYARGAAGSFEMDVPQLRQAFLLSEGVRKEIENFRAERVAKVIADATPVALKQGLKMVVHILPLSSFTSGSSVPAERFAERSHDMAPPDATAMNWRLGLEGVTVYDVGSGDGLSRSYSQFFREGRAEFVRTFEDRAGDGCYLPSTYYEDLCIRSVRVAVRRLGEFNIGAPFYVGLSLVNAKGYTLGVSRMVAFMNDRELRPFDHQHMIFPMIEVQDAGLDASRFMRPAFDLVWNAVGMRGSLNYDESGEWCNTRQ
jgi:Predicted transcriptional regulator containing an HTH domain and an uncharacterized domain shared with the mammalian protein Schlafen